MADFKELIDSIRKEQVTLFLGSGFSRKAGAPMANAIVSALKESMPDDVKEYYIDETHLDIISEEYEQIYSREHLINKLEDIFKFMPTDTSDHTCLPKIPHIRHIITTNYDTLIEDAYGPENCYVVRTTADCVNLPKDKTIIYKIHGDFIAKDNIVLTKQDYTNFFSDNNEPLLWKYIQSHILTNDMLFIGYSLEDTNIYTLIQEIRKQVKTDTRKYFLIAPGLLKHKIERLARTEIKYFNAKAEDLFPVLFETLNKRIKSDYQRKRICLDTFRRYSNQHYLQPIVEEGQKENRIIKFDAKGKTDIKIDKEKNVEIIVKEYIGHPSYPDVIGYPIPKIYPACCIEFPYESAQNIKSITIKNTEGEVFQNNSNIENEEWKKINLKNCKYYEDCNLKIDLDGDTQEENVEIKSSGKYIIINGKEYIVNKRANDENEDNKDDNLIHVLDNHCNVNQYYIIDMNNDNIMEIIHRTYSNMISPITSYYTIYNLYNYELVQIGEMSFMGNIPNNVYVKDNTIKFKYWPYESPDDYREEIVLDLQLNYLD